MMRPDERSRDRSRYTEPAGAHLGLLVRYADDFVVMCDTQAACAEAEQRVRAILAQRSMQRARQRVKERTGRNRNGVKEVRVLIRDLNPILRGWGNYFRTGNAARKFNQLDSYAWRRLHRFMVKRKGRDLRPGEAVRWTRDFYWNLGLHRLRGTVRYPGPSRMPWPDTSSVSRVRETLTHGLKGGPAPHRVTHGVT